MDMHYSQHNCILLLLKWERTYALPPCLMLGGVANFTPNQLMGFEDLLECNQKDKWGGSRVKINQVVYTDLLLGFHLRANMVLIGRLTRLKGQECDFREDATRPLGNGA